MSSFKKYSNPLLLGLKVIIFAFTLYYVYDEVFYSKKFDDLLASLKGFSSSGFLYLGIVLTLMPLNWGIEAFKWRFLLKWIQRIGYSRALRAVLSGVTVSVLLPNRSGEYLGRILYLPYKKTIKAIFATVVGSFSQLIITIIVGSTAFILFLGEKDQNDYFFSIIVFTILLLNFLLITIYFNIDLINRIIPQAKWFNIIRKYVNIFSYFHFYDLSTILFHSLVRYIVFLIQFILLLYTFGINDISVYHAVISISVIFLTQSVIPTIALTEIGVRGAVAIHFLGAYTDNTIGILSAAYSLWIINIIIPAVFGAFFLLFSKKSRRKSRKVREVKSPETGTVLKERVVN